MDKQNEMFEKPISRSPRTSNTREKTAARKPWAPPSMLDAPPAPDGFKHRWIRAETRGFNDSKNISARIREGWELVRKDEYPDFEGCKKRGIVQEKHWKEVKAAREWMNEEFKHVK